MLALPRPLARGYRKGPSRGDCGVPHARYSSTSQSARSEDSKEQASTCCVDAMKRGTGSTASVWRIAPPGLSMVKCRFALKDARSGTRPRVISAAFAPSHQRRSPFCSTAPAQGISIIHRESASSDERKTPGNPLGTRSCCVLQVNTTPRSEAHAHFEIGDC